MSMKKNVIAAGKFKAECLRLIDRVADTHEPLVVTKRGKPVVEVIAIQKKTRKTLHGSVTVRGDIVSPNLDSWDLGK